MRDKKTFWSYCIDKEVPDRGGDPPRPTPLSTHLPPPLPLRP